MARTAPVVIFPVYQKDFSFLIRSCRNEFPAWIAVYPPQYWNCIQVVVSSCQGSDDLVHFQANLSFCHKMSSMTCCAFLTTSDPGGAPGFHPGVPTFATPLAGGLSPVVLATSSALIRFRAGGDGYPASAPSGGFHTAGTCSTGGSCLLCRGTLYLHLSVSHHWWEVCGRCLSYAFHHFVRLCFHLFSWWFLDKAGILSSSNGLSAMAQMSCPIAPDKVWSDLFPMALPVSVRLILPDWEDVSAFHVQYSRPALLCIF